MVTNKKCWWSCFITGGLSAAITYGAVLSVLKEKDFTARSKASESLRHWMSNAQMILIPMDSPYTEHWVFQFQDSSIYEEASTNEISMLAGAFQFAVDRHHSNRGGVFNQKDPKSDKYLYALYSDIKQIAFYSKYKIEWNTRYTAP